MYKFIVLSPMVWLAVDMACRAIDFVGSINIPS